MKEKELETQGINEKERENIEQVLSEHQEIYDKHRNIHLKGFKEVEDLEKNLPEKEELDKIVEGLKKSEAQRVLENDANRREKLDKKIETLGKRDKKNKRDIEKFLSDPDKLGIIEEAARIENVSYLREKAIDTLLNPDKTQQEIMDARKEYHKEVDVEGTKEDSESFETGDEKRLKYKKRIIAALAGAVLITAVYVNFKATKDKQESDDNNHYLKFNGLSRQEALVDTQEGKLEIGDTIEIILPEEAQKDLEVEDSRTIKKSVDVEVPQHPELQWTDSYNVGSGETIQGPAIIEKHDGWIKVNFGEEYTLSEGGHANFYTGNQAGLDAEYARTLKEFAISDEDKDKDKDVIDVEVPQHPELQWTDSYNVGSGETIQGPAIIEKHDGWIKVNFGEEYTLSEGGHANFYTGNQAGLDAEYARTIKE